MTSCWANIRSISARSKRRPRRWGRQRLAAVAADGSVGFQGQRRRGQKAHSLRQFPADPNLLAIAQSVKSDYRQGKVVEGVIGSADVEQRAGPYSLFPRPLPDVGRRDGDRLRRADRRRIQGAVCRHSRVVQQHHQPRQVRSGKPGWHADYVYQVVKAYIANLKKH